MKEHKRGMKSDNFSNVSIIHNISTNHRFDFHHSNIIAIIHEKKTKEES